MNSKSLPLFRGELALCIHPLKKSCIPPPGNGRGNFFAEFIKKLDKSGSALIIIRGN